MRIEPGPKVDHYLTVDEIKLVEKYREALEKLQPGQSGVGRHFSWLIPDGSGDQISVLVSLSHSSAEPRSSSTDVIVERARAQL